MNTTISQSIQIILIFSKNRTGSSIWWNQESLSNRKWRPMQILNSNNGFRTSIWVARFWNWMKSRLDSWIYIILYWIGIFYLEKGGSEIYWFHCYLFSGFIRSSGSECIWLHCWLGSIEWSGSVGSRIQSPFILFSQDCHSLLDTLIAVWKWSMKL